MSIAVVLLLAGCKASIVEYVKVVYKSTRDVFIDGMKSGKTNAVLNVERGMHTFDMGSPVDYSPSKQQLNVLSTSQFAPLEIVFE